MVGALTALLFAESRRCEKSRPLPAPLPSLAWMEGRNALIYSSNKAARDWRVGHTRYSVDRRSRRELLLENIQSTVCLPCFCFVMVISRGRPLYLTGKNCVNSLRVATAPATGDFLVSFHVAAYFLPTAVYVCSLRTKKTRYSSVSEV